MTVPSEKLCLSPDEARDPEGFTKAARDRAVSLCALGATVDTLSPGKAVAWYFGHCFLIRDNGELTEL